MDKIRLFLQDQYCLRALEPNVSRKDDHHLRNEKRITRPSVYSGIDQTGCLWDQQMKLR